jgi:hypothetical protein
MLDLYHHPVAAVVKDRRGLMARCLEGLLAQDVHGGSVDCPSAPGWSAADLQVLTEGGRGSLREGTVVL